MKEEYMCSKILSKECHMKGAKWEDRNYSGFDNEKDSCVHAIMHEHSDECDEDCVVFDGRSPCVKPFDDDFIAQEEMEV